MHKLDGKVALVTGSTSGIGLGIARALAAAGSHVVLNGFGDKVQIDELVADFRPQYKAKVEYTGWVLTPLVQKQIDAIAALEKLTPDAAKMKLLGEKQPSLEFATPDEIGAAALFPCSQAAVQIRGIALPVDGGWTAQ